MLVYNVITLKNLRFWRMNVTRPCKVGAIWAVKLPKTPNVTSVFKIFPSLLAFAVVTVAYIVCYMLTASLITPIQSTVLPEITFYASLMYLPFGVRVLATMFLDWRAIPPLMVGSGVAGWMFGPDPMIFWPDMVLLMSILVGATCAFVSFEVCRWAGLDAYCLDNQPPHWKSVIVVGVLASFRNSAGQTIVFGGFSDLGQPDGTALVYLIGDVIGLVVTMTLLMLLFR